MICVAHLLDTDAFAGTERYVLQLAAGLAQAGAAPLIVCRRNTPLHERAKAAAMRVWPGLGTRPGVRGTQRLLRFLHEQHIDVLHVHNGRTSLTAALANAACGIPCVMTQHFITPHFATHRGLKSVVAHAAHRWVNSRLARVCCISDATREAMIAREGISAEKAVTVRNGIDALPPLSDGQREAARKSLGITGDGALMVCVARLEVEKGHTFLLEALPAVLRAFPATRMAFVGDGARRAALEAHAKAMGVSNAVIFTGFREDAAVLTGACDLFVLPSPAEPFGLAIVEAMSVGKAVIACAAGGPIEIIEDGETGLLVPPSDSTALAAAIVRVLGDEALRSRLAAGSSEAFRQRFTAERMVRETIEVYRGVLDSGRRAQTGRVPLPKLPERPTGKPSSSN